MRGRKNITAIYARQSADRIDSISIDTQIDFCIRRLNPDESYQVFFDKGYTGANTKRPQFQKMLELCKKGEIQKIITYKLDRISRSLLDFVLLLSQLEKQNTELISCTESFSSKSEMGVLIMKLLIMFAEMERKNIKMRVRDNYYARGEKGFYLGGYPPFGYEKCEVVIDGKKTCGYKIINSEMEIIKEIYDSICNKKISATAVCRNLNLRGVLTKRGSKWTATTLTRLIKNPFYVKADIKMYEYLLKNGGKITSDYEKFNGTNGVIYYGKSKKSGRFENFHDGVITIGNHKGIISSSEWIKARDILSKSSSLSKCKSEISFLTGLIYCKNCNSRLTMTTSKGYTYFYCRQKKTCGCNTQLKFIRSDFLEKISTQLIKERLMWLSEKYTKKDSDTLENKIRSELAVKKSKLDITQKRMAECDEQEYGILIEIKIGLLKEINDLEDTLKNNVANSKKLCYTEFQELSDNFLTLNTLKKREIANEIIEKIVISKGEISFYLKQK